MFISPTGSVYGTADGGSSRESLNTVHGYTLEPPTTPGAPPILHANGAADAKALESLNGSKYQAGNDQATSTPPLNTVTASLAEHGASQYPTPSTPPKSGNLFLEIGHLSSSPTHSPNLEAQKSDGIHAKMHANDSGSSIKVPKVEDSTAGTDPNARDFADEEPAARPSPSRSQTQSSYQYASASLLHPSSAATPTAPSAFKDIVTAATSAKPGRRNTTGSSNPPKSKTSAGAAGGPLALSTSGIGASGATAGIIHDGWDPELDEDMKKQAEQIRRERKRRDLEAQEAERIKEEGGSVPGVKRDSKGKERGHTRSGSAGAKSTGGRSGKSLDEWKPIVGNVVGEGHVNYILMYNMLTGIRVAVSLELSMGEWRSDTAIGFEVSGQAT